MPKKWPLFCAKMKCSAMHKTKDAFWVSCNALLNEAAPAAEKPIISIKL